MVLNNKMCLDFLRRNKQKIIQNVKSKSYEDDDLSEIDSLLDIENKSKYLFSKSVVETLDSIKLTNEFDCNILRSRKTISGIILLNKTELYIFNTCGDNLRVIYFDYSVENDSSAVLIFTFKITENEKIVLVDYNSEISKKFLQCIIYLDFLPTEIKYINPKEKIGNLRADKIINKTDDKFILVTKAWNQKYETLPNTKYLSRAHWGIRWTGKERKIPTLTFIKASLKEMEKQAEKETKR